MSEKNIENQGENQDINQDTEKQKEIIRVNAYFFLHEDSFNEIVQSMILLKDYRETWKIIRKRNKFYVIFDDNRKYLKLWTDKRQNLLFYIGEFNNNLFYDSIEIREYDTGCLIFTNNGIYCENKAIEFKNIDLINVIREIDYRLVDPLIWLLCKVLY